MPKLFDNVDTRKTRFHIVNKANSTYEILIYGSIGQSWWDETAVTAKDFTEELKKIPESTKEIHVRINSGGGSVFEGVTIYERLKQHKAKKVVYVDGIAASIASVIAMAGDEIYVGDGSFMMIHRPMSPSFGNSSEHERTIAILDKIEEQMVTIYAKKCGLPRAEISRMLAEETWMPADTAVELGFATSKTEASENLHIAASILATAPKGLFRYKPEIEAKSAVMHTKAEELKNKIMGFQSRIAAQKKPS